MVLQFLAPFDDVGQTTPYERSFLANPTRPSFQSEVENVQQGAQALGMKLIVLNASTDAEIDTAFAEFSRQQIGALLLRRRISFFDPLPPDRRVGKSFADRDDVLHP